MVLTDGPRKLLFDYGMTPARPPEYPLPVPPGIDLACFTHAHLDHVGMGPAIGDNVSRILTTSMTGQLAELMLQDATKVARLEGFPSKYSIGDIRRFLERIISVEQGGTLHVKGAEVTLTPAGHVPGATMFLYRGEKDLLFTGDVQTHPSQLVGESKVMPCEVLVMESTYAGREHPSRSATEERFCQAIERVVDGGGQVVVPAFAMGRSQEIIMVLAKKGFEVWVDGMARQVNELYYSNPRALRDARAFKRALADVRVVEEPRDRHEALRYADVIVTPSGMLDGGPALFYLGSLSKDPKSAVFLTGYQVEGSNGRELVERGTITVGGVTIRPSCQMDSFDFSAHAGHTELVQLARSANPKKIVLMHGDKRELLKADLEKDFQVILPEDGEVVHL
jgi:putative mRNA 3-end processing factor